MPFLVLTLAQIEDLIAQDEAQLAAYQEAAADAESDGLNPSYQLPDMPSR